MPMITIGGLDEDKGVLFAPVPPGHYPATISSIEETESKEDKDGNCKPMLKCKVALDMEDGETKSIFHNLVMPNKFMSDKANELSRARIKRLLNACGIGTSNDGFDSQDLQDAQFIAVVIQKDEQNEIKDYLKRE